MREMTLEEFIKNHATKTDACLYYNEYSKEVQESLNNIFKACWRFDLRNRQAIYMLNEALKPFDLMGILK